MSLDGNPPRHFPSEGGLRLGDLPPENEPIREGTHLLLVALTDELGRVLRGPGAAGPAPFSVVAFSVGVGGEASAPPSLFCLSPRGTYYGMPESGLRLELVTIDEAGSASLVEAPKDVATARLRIQGRELDQVVEVDPGQPYAIRGLPFGDVRITDLASTAACVATLNPERPRE